MKRFALLMSLFFSGAIAHAEDFRCEGFGRFETLSKQPIEVTYEEKEIFASEDERYRTRVRVSRFSRTENFRKYLRVEVSTHDKQSGYTTINAASGSILDIVSYGEFASWIVCTPL